MIAMLRENLNNMFNALVAKDPKLTSYQVARLAKTNYNNLRDALEGKRPFSENQLRDLADSGFFDVSFQQLMAWKLLEEQDPEVLKLANDALIELDKHSKSKVSKALEVVSKQKSKNPK